MHNILAICSHQAIKVLDCMNFLILLCIFRLCHLFLILSLPLVLFPSTRPYSERMYLYEYTYHHVMIQVSDTAEA